MSAQTSHHSAPRSPAADPNSSSSTLVGHPPTTPAMVMPDHTHASPTTPFSVTFDPNLTTPNTRDPPAQRDDTPLAATSASMVVGVDPTQADALWTHRLSASFGTIADQIAAASRALATVDVPAPSGGSGGQSGAADVVALSTRLDAIERTQEAMGGQLRAVQEALAAMQSGGMRESICRENGVVEEAQAAANATTEASIQELQAKVDGVVETIRLDQARLYARLHNAAVIANKMAIRAPVLANGKTPQNFPNTKGEFEHLNKERYEALLQAYGLPVKGDTNAKREALREFIGLSSAV